MDFLLLSLDIDFFSSQFVLLVLDNLAIPRHLLIQLLLEPAHQGIHHLIPTLLHFKLAAELAELALQLVLSLLSLLKLLIGAADLALEIVH